MRLRKPFASGPRFEAEWLVVGLGNPGEAHARNRHNVGFWVVNELARRAGVQPKAQGSTMLIAVGPLAGQRVALVKPKTFVNLSGKAVSQALQWTGAGLDRTIAVYDELDMSSGALRIRGGGGHGGHNGIRSIVQSVGPGFTRVRVGIGRPLDGGEPTWDPDVVAGYVLGNPQGEERTRLEETARLAADAIEAVITEGVDAAGNRFNRK
jgi:PTH1 family peptidyl-tRNA hydrolase